VSKVGAHADGWVEICNECNSMSSIIIIDKHQHLLNLLIFFIRKTYLNEQVM